MRSPWFLVFLLIAALCSAQDYVAQTSNTAENLRGVSAPAPGIAWASGTHGTYLRTLDGGTTWQAAQVPGAESLDFRDVEAFSADLAYLLAAGPGEQSRIYKTTDRGVHWMLQFTNRDPKGFFDCMAFWDRDHGIALGDPTVRDPAQITQGTARYERAQGPKFVLITTEDGGKNWKRIPPEVLPAAIDGEGAFAASGTCIAVAGKSNVWFATGGKVARVFHSTNRGRTWTVANTPIVQGNDSSGIFSIDFRDPKHGAIAGGDYQHPDQGGANLAFTADGGQTWKISPISPQSYFSAVAFLPKRSSSILAVGTTRAGYSDDIQRRMWTKSWELNLNALAIDKTGNALVVGPKGTILHFVMGH
ncbi:MAG: glycosyl hydrolase [Acidobacteriia bacterium]|nr:glycosyl hydrolase [Terriglobia bacterium]